MKNKSFTLIELLVVIVIIGILAGVIMISTSSSIDKANFAKAKAFSSTVQNELLSNLVSEWTFDNSSNLGEDTWGNNHGIIHGTIPQAKNNCVFGACLSFNNNSDYIDCGNNDNLNSSSITIAGWIKISNLTGTYQFLVDHKYSEVIYLGAMQVGETLHPRAYIKDHLGVAKFLENMNYNLNDKLWHYLALTYNDGNGKLWLDGIVVDDENYWSGGLPSSSSCKTFISNSGSYPVNGLIDDVRIYNAALSSSQIKQNYIAGLNSMLANGNISKEDYNERINTLAYEQE